MKNYIMTFLILPFAVAWLISITIIMFAIQLFILPAQCHWRFRQYDMEQKRKKLFPEQYKGKK